MPGRSSKKMKFKTSFRRKNKELSKILKNKAEKKHRHLEFKKKQQQKLANNLKLKNIQNKYKELEQQEQLFTSTLGYYPEGGLLSIVSLVNSLTKTNKKPRKRGKNTGRVIMAHPDRYPLKRKKSKQKKQKNNNPNSYLIGRANSRPVLIPRL